MKVFLDTCSPMYAAGKEHPYKKDFNNTKIAPLEITPEEAFC
jgi:hypothetical protein